MELSKELIAKAKNAENAEALGALAKENGWEMTQEEAKAYFTELHKSGALSDEELENVTGGGCRKDEHLVVTLGYGCNDLWRCKKHRTTGNVWIHYGDDFYWGCGACLAKKKCNYCYYCHYEGGLWLCYNPEK